jgi:hypothetical protein
MGCSRRHPPKPIARHPLHYQGENQMKTYRVNPQIGTSKHSVSFHDGESKHKDGSEFFDLKIFKTKRQLAKFVKYLQNNGYQPI